MTFIAHISLFRHQKVRKVMVTNFKMYISVGVRGVIEGSKHLHLIFFTSALHILSKKYVKTFVYGLTM